MLHTPNRLPLTMARCPGAGTPFAVSVGAKGSDDLWTHVNDKLRERIKCKCGKKMPADEYLRKFHPEAALLNLAANDPKTDQECDFGYHMLHSEVQNFFKDYVRKYTHNPENAAGLIPCTYTELATTGCVFELKSQKSDMPLGLGMAMKTCPEKPDMTYTTFVVKGDLADNMAKPCDSNTGCGTGSIRGCALSEWAGLRRCPRRRWAADGGYGWGWPGGHRLGTRGLKPSAHCLCDG